MRVDLRVRIVATMMAVLCASPAEANGDITVVRADPPCPAPTLTRTDLEQIAAAQKLPRSSPSGAASHAVAAFVAYNKVIGDTWNTKPPADNPCCLWRVVSAYFDTDVDVPIGELILLDAPQGEYADPICRREGASLRLMITCAPRQGIARFPALQRWWDGQNGRGWCIHAGVLVPHGSEHPFYQGPVLVPYGSTCKGEARTCLNGEFEPGALANDHCEAAKSPDCMTGDGKVLADGSRAVLFGARVTPACNREQFEGRCEKGLVYGKAGFSTEGLDPRRLFTTCMPPTRSAGP
jgi:hypothetical protein